MTGIEVRNGSIVGLRDRGVLAFRYFLLMKLPLWSLLGAGLWLRPLETVLVFLLPAFITLFHTTWATYEHHAGLPQDNHLVAMFSTRMSAVRMSFTGPGRSDISDAGGAPFRDRRSRVRFASITGNRDMFQ